MAAGRTEGTAGSTRAEVRELRDNPRASVLIIGGGINGVGTFRDLALQGVDVALVERGDYCQGASGASSHMIHGGIRYLENGEFRLVHESVVERNALMKIAPHYVKPLKTTIPIFTTFSGILSAPLRFLTHKQGKQVERGAVLIKAGLTMYDFFSRDGGNVPRHSFVGRRKALETMPDLPKNVRYAATYFDASVHNPERLTLDVLRDGQIANPSARAVNYVSAIGNDDDGVRLRDELTGETFSFQADVVVNASGAWTDITNTALGSESRFMGGTKGSHIVLDHPELLQACNGTEIFFEHTDGRIVLIYPMGDRVLVGTTDIDVDVTEQAVCTDEEIEYFFELIGHVFPDIEVTTKDIVYSFSGVRPLPRHDETQPGFVSRDYRIEKREEKLGGRDVTTLSLVGGKWTTFRALSEHLADDTLAALGSSRKTSTAGLAIGGGQGFPTDEAAERAWIRAAVRPGFDEDRVRVLLTRYGTRASDVIEYLTDGPDTVFNTTRELSTRELAYMVEHEQIGHLIDVLIRRTSLAFRGLVTEELLAELSETLAPLLGWDAEQAAAEIELAEKVLAEAHRVQVKSLTA
ncbi:glycerol-3-phosphate dehydrogenase/oxidase [Arthrobacter echini]|uniref:glycerol-3-phosphate dehydrogenase/oxidase n=1 Tax=Arthrobacter echini TaxID=1529066 RepID=UPI001FE815FC|nr:glycerol-3-phosphate dehydrogenase/oxidase [Arthrobacter echini]